jgi:preprotein translocase subunit SecE
LQVRVLSALPDNFTTRERKRFIRDLVSEMRRVTWPSRQEWVSATILTIALVTVIGLYTYLCDQLFGFVFGLIQHH